MLRCDTISRHIPRAQDNEHAWPIFGWATLQKHGKSVELTLRGLSEYFGTTSLKQYVPLSRSRGD